MNIESDTLQKELVIHSYAEASLAGTRPDNQDRLTRFQSSFGEVILLADGMGGHRSGSLAAELIIREFPRYLRDAASTLPLRDILEEAARKVNQRIFALGHKGDPALARMGSTLVVAALCLSNNTAELVVANAGDSRAYLWRNGELRMLTRDHTVASRLVEAGILNEKEAPGHPESHVLTRSVGQSEDLELEFSESVSLSSGDVVLLCSDGFSGYVRDDEIRRILGYGRSADSTVQSLSQAAIEGGSKDNISIQYVRIAETVNEVRAGAMIGKYRLEAFLGSGGMAQVWLGRHENLHSPAAIKILDPSYAPGIEIRERFLREGERQAALQHPAIVRVEGYDETTVGSDHLAYLILQYIDGESLHARMKRLGKQSSSGKQFSGTAYRVLDALEFAHAHKLVHRDVKSSNILLDREGNAYLGDFGLVLSQDDPRLTEVTRVMGTSEYMSPEQIRTPKSLDSRTDIYSLGCVLYEMLSGETPFAYHDDDFAIKLAHVKETPRPIRKLNARVSPALEAVVLRALEKDPADRWQSCAEFRKALREAVDEERFPPPLRWNLRRFVAKHRVAASVVAAVCILLTLGVGIGRALWNNRQEKIALQLAGDSERAFRRGDRIPAVAVALQSLWEHHTGEGEDSLMRALAGLGHPARLLAQVTNTPIAFSPDGRWLAAIRGSVVTVWGLQTGQSAFELTSPDFFGTIAFLSWSPDGKNLAASSNNTVLVWDLQHPNAPRKLEPTVNQANLTILAWSNQGTLLLGLNERGRRYQAEVCVWNTGSGRLVRTIAAPGAESLSWIPDYEGFAVGTVDGRVEFWNNRWRKIDSSSAGDDPVTSVAFTSQAARIAAVKGGKSVTIWLNDPALPSNDSKLTLNCAPNEEPGNVTSQVPVGWSPDGRLLACAEGNKIGIWETSHVEQRETGRLLQTILADDYVFQVAWSPDGTKIAFTSYGKLYLWDVAFSPLGQPLVSGTIGVNALSWTPDGGQLVSAGESVRVWDAARGKLLRTIDPWEPVPPPKGEEIVFRAGPTPDVLFASGKRAASAGMGLEVWDVNTGQHLRSTPGPLKEKLLAGSPDGRQLAWSTYEGESIVLRNAESDAIIAKLNGRFSSAVWSPDGKYVALLSSSGPERTEVQIWEPATGDHWSAVHAHDEQIGAVAWSPDNRLLATGSFDKSVAIWDVETHKLLRQLYGHSAPVISLAWTQDSRWLASGSGDNTVKIWNPASGQLAHTIEAHDDSVTSLAWSRDGRLATGSDDGLAKIWIMDPKTLDSMACSYITLNLTLAEWNQLMPGIAYRKACPDRP